MSELHRTVIITNIDELPVLQATLKSTACRKGVPTIDALNHPAYSNNMTD
jgi:hypothetical protein